MCSGLMWRTALLKVLQDCQTVESLQIVEAKEFRNDQKVPKDKERNLLYPTLHASAFGEIPDKVTSK